MSRTRSPRTTSAMRIREASCERPPPVQALTVHASATSTAAAPAVGSSQRRSRWPGLGESERTWSWAEVSRIWPGRGISRSAVDPEPRTQRRAGQVAFGAAPGAAGRVAGGDAGQPEVHLVYAGRDGIGDLAGGRGGRERTAFDAVHGVHGDLRGWRLVAGCCMGGYAGCVPIRK